MEVSRDNPQPAARRDFLASRMDAGWPIATRVEIGTGGEGTLMGPLNGGLPQKLDFNAGVASFISVSILMDEGSPSQEDR
jgi:hypothetical protein